MVRVLAIATLALAASAKIFTRNFDVMDLIESQHTEDVQAGVPEEWFESQKLDHNDASNNKVWSQRFFTNDEFYGGAGYPVFVYINGENVARNTTVLSKGLYMNVLAKKHKALIVSLEHRYYGKSQPVPDFTTANMKYLTAENALNDLALFQDHLIAKRKLVDSKWVAFGGSYPGMLAAWARLKHPSRFVGSVASSGPILAKVNFHEYAEKCEYGLRYHGGDACVNNVKEGLVAFHKLVASTKPEDVALLKKYFNPCTPVQNDWDRMTLESNVYFPFEGLSQSNDYAAYGLKQVCEDFAKPGKTPIEKIADFNTRNSGGASCTWVDYQSAWIDESLTSPVVTTTGINRQWTYQTCAEFGFGQNSASSKSIFSELSYVTVEKTFNEVCRQAFNISDTEARTVITNKKYGALKIDVSNVAFPTGTVDGWAALAPSNETGVVNPKSEVIDIEGISHCGDMSAPKPTDSGHLVWGHQRVEAAVERFLRNQC